MDPYINPTSFNSSNKSYGNNTGQFMIDPYMQPFPFQQQKQENEALVAGYTGAIAGQKTMPQLYSQYENRYNLPQLREGFQTTREGYQDVINQLRAMPETVASTSRQSLMTSGQKANLVMAKQAPLQKTATSMGETLTQIGTMLTENEKNVNTALQYEIAQQKKELAPWEWKYDLQKIIQAQEFTGWTTANRLELDRLISNRDAGLGWTNAEANRANELAKIEKQYELELRNLEKQSQWDVDYANKFFGF